MTIFAIDPGNTKSAYVVYDSDKKILNKGILENEAFKDFLEGSNNRQFAIEMVACYGMPVGAEVFDTVLWIGRFIETIVRGGGVVDLVFRRDIKLHLCGTVRAKDGNIRQALIDKLGPVGTKKSPGPLHGVSSHTWAALAVAVFHTENK